MHSSLFDSKFTLANGLNLTDLKNKYQEKSLGEVTNVVENCVAFYTALLDCTTKRQAIATTFMFIKTFYNKSVVELAKDYLVEAGLFTTLDLDRFWNNDFEVLEHQAALDIDWLELLRKAKDNWTTVVHAPAFTKLSKLISMFAALGLCELSHFNVDFNGVRIFSVGAHQRHVSASDFIQALLETVAYFSEGIYQCFKTGDWSIFLYEDAEAQKFDDDYFTILELSSFVRCGNLERFSDGKMTENDYDLLLQNTLEKAKTIMRGLKGPEKSIMSRKVEQLQKCHAEYIQFRTSGTLREAPYGIYIHGTSSVGKSYIASLLMRIVLKANDFNSDDDHLITINDSDKYMSTARSYVTGIFLDDVGNTKPDFAEKAPTQHIIDLCNNIPYYANMAEVEQKGKISLEPKCMVTTSNLTCDRLAGVYSNDIMSILRRSNLHITVTVKEEYTKNGVQLDSAKVLRDFKDDPYPDVWNFHCQYADNSEGTAKLVNLFPAADLNTVLEHVIDDSKKHFANQKFVVENSTNLGQKLIFCEMCNRPTKICQCKQAAFELPDDVKKAWEKLKEYRCLSLLFALSDNKFYTHNLNFLIAILRRYNIWKGGVTFRRAGHMSLLSFAVINAMAPFMFPISILWLFASFFSYWASFFITWKEEIEKLAKARNVVRQIFTDVRKANAVRFFNGFVLIAILYKIIKRFYVFWKLQANLTPMSKEDIEARDAEKNPWIGAGLTQIPQSEDVRVAPQQMKSVVDKHLMYIRFPEHPDGVLYCNAFFLKTNFAIVPQHIFYEDSQMFEVYHKTRTNAFTDETFAHKRGHGIMSRDNTFDIPNTDLCIAYLPGCGSFKDITSYFPDKPMKNFYGNMYHRKSNGELGKYQVYPTYSENIKVQRKRYQGYLYTIKGGTFNGLCVSTIVTDTNPSVIAGFHIAGCGSSGAAGVVAKCDIRNAEEFFETRVSVLNAASDGEFPKKQFGLPTYEEGSGVHPKSFVNHLPESAILQTYGSCSGISSAKSVVVKTPISDDVAEVCGVPCKHGPPKMHKWKPYFVNAQAVSDPSLGMSGEALEWAARDYIKPLVEKVHDEPWNHELKPLNRLQTVSGIDGKRFIDKMPPNTSAGYPLSQAKKNLQVALNPSEHPDFTCPVTFTDEVWEEFEKVISCYKNGERAYPIFKAALKDEPTKLTKDKVRVFFGAPLTLQLAVRMYFMPILRFMSMHPFLSECAVGINAQGPEWDQLAKHMKSFGEDRIFAGDYKAFDTRMPAQLTMAAYNVLINIAEASGNYSEEDIHIMKGIATDCCYPFVAYNGTLVSFNGVHISGINVTAYVGCVMNSLLQRGGYYTISKELGKPMYPYRRIASVVNYGDDFKGSVSVEADHFNFISFQAFLKDCGITLTMPDKESAPEKYLTDERADFLKRHNIYNEELDQIFGALDKDSIFKSLHCVLRSKVVSPDTVAMMNIDGALREMWFHGREDYETLRSQLQEVAARHNYANCMMLSRDYDYQMTEYKSKYYGGEPPETEDLEDFDFELQGGFEKKHLNSKEYARSRWNMKHSETRVKETGFVHEIEDDTVLILRRHHSSNQLEGLHHLESFFLIKKTRHNKNVIDLVHKMPHKPCIYETQLQHRVDGTVIGDIDIGFYLGGKNEFAIFEVKEADNKNMRTKARKQVRVSLEVLKRHNKNAVFHGFILCDKRIEYVESTEDPSKKVVRKFPFRLD